MHVSRWQRCANTPEPLVGACLFEVVMGVKTVIREQSVREPGANVPCDRTNATDEAVVLYVADRFHNEHRNRALPEIEH